MPLSANESYDLIIQGGRVIDASQDLDGVLDVAIRDGKIARVEAAIPADGSRRIISARGRIVTPGLIDAHAHVFPYVGPYGIEPDPYCVERGVTTVVDAGTSGALTFPAFRRQWIERSATRIRALLHVVALGMVAGSTPGMGELEDLRYCEPKLAVKCARENPGVIVGLKMRFSKMYTGSNDAAGMEQARVAADDLGLPVMIHIGGSHSPLETFLALLKKGDVVTHCFNPHPHGLLDSNGRVTPAVRDALSRGVLLDVGHGAGSFSFDVAAKCLDQGAAPFTISSDLYSANVNGPVYDLVTTLSKFILLGMPLPEVVRRATLNASREFDLGAGVGTLRPGAEADVSVLTLEEGSFEFTDTNGQTRRGRERLVPFVTVRAGKEHWPAGSAEQART